MQRGIALMLIALSVAASPLLAFAEEYVLRSADGGWVLARATTGYHVGGAERRKWKGIEECTGGFTLVTIMGSDGKVLGYSTACGDMDEEMIASTIHFHLSRGGASLPPSRLEKAGRSR